RPVAVPSTRGTGAGPAQRDEIAVIDPVGLTAKRLGELGVANLRNLGDGTQRPAVLPKAIIVGREALIADEKELWQERAEHAAEQGLPPRERLEQTQRLRALPDWIADAVRSGARVLICEQTERVLTNTFGFRAVAVGVERAFVRCPWHATMRGIDNELLSFWRGSSTLTVDRTLAGPVGDPHVDWLNFDNTRVWKWGSYGQLASAVIEKPHCGDFLPIADCEFDLAYTPLLEYRHGDGRVLFCQLDISNRTEDEPVARRLWANLIAWLQGAEKLSAPPRRTGYVGDKAGRDLLATLKVSLDNQLDPAALTARDLLIVGRGARDRLGGAREQVAAAVRNGAIVVCLAPTPDDIEGWLPVPIKLDAREVIWTPVGGNDQWILRGIGPSELHWRGRLKIWAVAEAPSGSITTRTGLITAVPFGSGWVVICAATPDMFDADNPQRLYFRLSRERCAQMLSRLLANCGASFDAPVLENLATPPAFRANLLR
ncbi:MAG: hypothetical protein H5T86_15775, partial [Armatimonadetes bacterium]|nr:hypothetical protein [Armatimonadota bacterium]